MLSHDFVAGFLEAEASFGVVPNNAGSSWLCSMALSVREDDAELVDRCWRRFGIGTIDRRRGRGTSQPQVRWVVRRKPHVARLADIVGGRFRGRNSHVLAHWIEAVDLWTARSYGTSTAIHAELKRLAAAIKQLRPYRDTSHNGVNLPLSPAYLGGLITGEGSFTFSNRRPRFILHMRADETPLVEGIAADAGIGSIHMQPACGRSAPSISWQVHRSREMAALVRWLDGLELNGRKLEQFKAWRPAAVGLANAFSSRVQA